MNGKKSFSKMFFSVITKNLNWEILAKNLVTFKDGLRVKNFNIMGVNWKIWFLWKESQKTYRGEYLKKGLGQFANLRGGLTKKGAVGEFEGSWYPSPHYERFTKLVVVCGHHDLKLPKQFLIVEILGNLIVLVIDKFIQYKPFKANNRRMNKLYKVKKPLSKHK